MPAKISTVSRLYDIQSTYTVTPNEKMKGNKNCYNEMNRKL